MALHGDRITFIRGTVVGQISSIYQLITKNIDNTYDKIYTKV